MALRRGSTARSDAELVTATRDGDNEAFAQLWERHSAAALRFVRHYSPSADADDIVAEAYTRIFAALHAGNGPTDGFRPYLYATLRNIAKSWGAREQALSVDDLDASAAPDSGRLEAALERGITVRAFRSLPDRWRHVLWYTEVEGLDPHEVAPMFGVSPGGAASLAHRARSALRDAWVQAHISDRERPEACRHTVEKLARRARRGLTEREARKVDEHLAGCVACTAVAAEVDNISSRLTLVLVPLLLGAGALGTIEAIRSGSDAAVAAAGADGSGGGEGAAGDSGAGGESAGGGHGAATGSKVLASFASQPTRVITLVVGSMGAVAVVVGALAFFVADETPAEPLTPPVVAELDRADPSLSAAAPSTAASESPEPPPTPGDGAPSTPPRDAAPPSGTGTGTGSGAAAPLAAPTAALAFPADPRLRPALAGTAEPGATVQVFDTGGTQLAHLVVGPGARGARANSPRSSRRRRGSSCARPGATARSRSRRTSAALPSSPRS